MKPIKRIYQTMIVFAFLLLSIGCEKMDANFKEYLENTKTYSPKVKNLKATEGLKEVTLKWDNPESDIAKQILIDYQDDSLFFEQMTDSVFIDSLDIKFYTISVYTIDEFNNKSVPVSVTVFPNGENFSN